MSKTESALAKMLSMVLKYGQQHFSEILVGLGITSMIGSAVLAARATPKALDNINEVKSKNGGKCTKVEAIKASAKEYVPAIVTGAAGIACIVFADHKHLQKQAAMAAAYALLKDDFVDYKNGALKVLGERNEQKIRTAVAEQKIKDDPFERHERDNMVINTGKGTTLFYDSLSGRYFYHDIQKIKKAENEANRDLINGSSMTLNEFYAYLDLPEIELGRGIGWNPYNGLITTQFSYPPNDDRPIIVMSFATRPAGDYIYY